MHCPNCNAQVHDGSNFCTACGHRLTAREPKGKLWPPLLILGILSVLGTVLFFITLG